MKSASSRSRRSPRVVLAVTSAQSLKLMTGFPEFLSKRGWDVHVVASSTPSSPYPAEISFHVLPMVREPSPVRDLIALFGWFRLLLVLRPNLVVAGTPKAGLLGMAGAFATRVPARIYLLRGLRLESERGLKRGVLWVMEWISSHLATKVQAVSESLRREFVNHGLCSQKKIVVLGEGSSNGVELLEMSEFPSKGREALGLDLNTPVVGFVGRLTRDKGLPTLLSAVRLVCDSGAEVQILLVGPEEPTGSLEDSLVATGFRDQRVVWAGEVADARPYYRAMDLLCLPTQREGFPNVVLEAAVQGVPAIVSNVTGAVDSVIDGETGWLFELNNIGDLASKLKCLLADPRERHIAGQLARDRAAQRFDRAVVWSTTDEMFRYEAGLSSKRES